MENSKILTDSQNSKLIIQNLVSIIAIIFFGAILRLIPHPPNVAPIAAMALFGGFYLNKKYALAVPLIALFLSDILIGFYSVMPFVYGSFILTGLIGIWLKSRKSLKVVLFATLFSSVLFFGITNFGVWLAGGLYPHTIEGLVHSYYFALPFFRNTIIGNLMFVGLFFGSFEIVIKLSKQLRYGYLYQNRRQR